jgi:hypothetical protein
MPSAAPAPAQAAVCCKWHDVLTRNTACCCLLQIDQKLQEGDVAAARSIFSQQAWPELFEKHCGGPVAVGSAAAAGHGQATDGGSSGSGSGSGSGGVLSVHQAFRLHCMPLFDSVFGGKEGSSITSAQDFRACCEQVGGRVWPTRCAYVSRRPICKAALWLLVAGWWCRGPRRASVGVLPRLLCLWVGQA